VAACHKKQNAEIKDKPPKIFKRIHGAKVDFFNSEKIKFFNFRIPLFILGKALYLLTISNSILLKAPH
jgi:hypothetical protein